ncbi:unnamed protein product [Diatraea saccharalis]|uniref:Uncharacterized protein n=1 Tax=Diatraea saccharalis TaxID=40085 RepID=A0A9N9QZ09_9NEOP|nr:unnamed protein product [Diatraea saccharalis]
MLPLTNSTNVLPYMFAHFLLVLNYEYYRTDGAVGRVSTNAEKPTCGTYRASPHQTPKLPPDPPDVYEISPYATFAGVPGAMSGGSRAYTLQLRALARHDDDAAPPHQPCCDATAQAPATLLP